MLDALVTGFSRIRASFGDRHGGFKVSDSKTRRKVFTFCTNFKPNDNFCKQIYINDVFLIDV